jgi:uncharacterized repeat protein (TIGR03806 family)
LKITHPLSFEVEPGTGAYLVIQHLNTWAPPGRIVRVPDDPATDQAVTLLDLEGIAYGLDFHPRYRENGYLFVGHNLKVNGVAKTRVSRFEVSRESPYRCVPKSEQIIIDWESDGHNGGDLAFGSDGMLYVTSGDGTSDSDTNLRGQDMTQLTSKVLRIDVDHPSPGESYSVPSDNPFVNRPEIRPETWAFGLRNPWRMSYDAKTQQLWVGNNGQDLWETAYLVTKGANYGWSVYEGRHLFQPGRSLGPAPVVPPTVEHHHSEARSMTGGVVYHGARYPDLQGAYIYGDYSTGKIWAARHNGTELVSHREIADSPFQITGFGLDSAGELVVIDHQTGFYGLEPTPEREDHSKFPVKLSETGLYLSTPERLVEPALIPYTVNAPLWSDGAQKERHLAVPGTEKVEFTAGGTGWNFPEGTVLVKTFLVELATSPKGTPSPIETRLFTKQQGEWVGYSYIWNQEKTDASLVPREGMNRVIETHDPAAPGGRRKQEWRYPSRAECLVCHSRAANFVLGLSDIQMNKDHDYGSVTDNQLRTLEHIELFSGPLPARPEAMPRAVDPKDAGAELEERVRSYLHTNCANCHVEAGGGNAQIDLAFKTPLQKMRLVDVKPLHDSFGISDARLVAPGDPERSVLLRRIATRGTGQMPPLATSRVDEQATQLLTSWIKGLGHEQK